VTTAGPALIQPQVTVTGADGTYRYRARPPGVYSVSFELSGFQTLNEGIRRGLNETLTPAISILAASKSSSLAARATWASNRASAHS
jgi:hypothetical protein